MPKSAAITANIVLLFAVNAGAGTLVDLAGAVALAERRSPDIASAIYFARSTSLLHKNAQAHLLPSLDLATTQGRYDGRPPPNPASPWFDTASLQLSENLYDNGVTVTEIQSTAVTREIGALQLEAARNRLTADVASAYFQYSLLVELLATRDRQQQTLQRQLENIRRAHRDGLRTRKDLVRIEAEVERSNLDLLAEKARLADSEQDLRRVVGIADGNEAVRFKPLPAPPPETANLILPVLPIAGSRTYTGRLASLQRDFETYAVRLQRRENLPRIELTGGVDWEKQDYFALQKTSTSPTLTWNVTLNLSYNIFDWGIRRRNVEVAELLRDTHYEAIRKDLIGEGAEIQKLAIEIDRLSRSLSGSKRLLQAGESSYTLLESDYREGKVAYLDLITSLNELLDARIAYYDNYFQALDAIARYRYFEGSAYDVYGPK